MGVTNVGGAGTQNKVWHGTCKSPSAEQKKTVDVGAGFELRDGAKIRVYFQGNSLSNFTLNVNNTGDIDVIPADGGELYSGLINQGYFNFTYTETEWGSSGTVYPVWILDNTQTGGTSTYGVVRVIDGPNPSFGANRGIAASPKALQNIKDIADAALPKAGGTMSGDLSIEKENAKLRLEDTRTNIYKNYIEATSGNSAVLTAHSDGGLSGAKIVVSNSNSNISITANPNTASITGVTQVSGNTDVTNKAYVDRMSGKAFSDGTSYKAQGGYRVFGTGHFSVRTPEDITIAKVTFIKDASSGTGDSHKSTITYKVYDEDFNEVEYTKEFAGNSNGGVFFIADVVPLSNIVLTNGASVTGACILVETIG